MKLELESVRKIGRKRALIRGKYVNPALACDIIWIERGQDAAAALGVTANRCRCEAQQALDRFRVASRSKSRMNKPE